MTRRKARVEFLLNVIELLFSISCGWGATRQGGRSLGAKISGGRGHPWGIFFSFCKTRRILLSDSANCTALRAVVLTQYRRVTDRQIDGQTDGIAVASTALGMRALRRAVKTEQYYNASVACNTRSLWQSRFLSTPAFRVTFDLRTVGYSYAAMPDL